MKGDRGVSHLPSDAQGLTSPLQRTDRPDARRRGVAESTRRPRAEMYKCACRRPIRVVGPGRVCADTAPRTKKVKWSLHSGRDSGVIFLGSRLVSTFDF